MSHPLRYPLAPLTPEERAKIVSLHSELPPLFDDLDRRLRRRPEDRERLRPILGALLRFQYDYFYLLPASEPASRGHRRSPHHAHPAGLLLHSADTARRLLHFRVPRSTLTLTIALRHTAFLLALLHDTGKLLNLHLADLSASPLHRDPPTWDPFAQTCADFWTAHPRAQVTWIYARTVDRDLSDWRRLVDPEMLQLLDARLPLGEILRVAGAHFLGAPNLAWLIEPFAMARQVRDFPKHHPLRTLLSLVRRADRQSQFASIRHRGLAALAEARGKAADLRRRIAAPIPLLTLRPDVAAPLGNVLRAALSLEAFLRPDTFPPEPWLADAPPDSHLAIRNDLAHLYNTLYSDSSIRFSTTLPAARAPYYAHQIRLLEFDGQQIFETTHAELRQYARHRYGLDSELVMECEDLRRQLNHRGALAGRFFAAAHSRLRHAPPLWDTAGNPYVPPAPAAPLAELSPCPAKIHARPALDLLLDYLGRHGIASPRPAALLPLLPHLPARERILLPRLATLAFILSALPALAKSMSRLHAYPDSPLDRLHRRLYAPRVHGVPLSLAWLYCGQPAPQKITQKWLLAVSRGSPTSTIHGRRLSTREWMYLLREIEIPRRALNFLLRRHVATPFLAVARHAASLLQISVPMLLSPAPVPATPHQAQAEPA